jgi:hypothetical protein
MPIYFASVRSRRQGKHCATKITSKTTVPMTPELQAAEEMEVMGADVRSRML